MTSERELALTAKAWPFEEARKLAARYAKAPPAKGYVLFETGYGPSGLPHIGTFGEVVRTSMVRRAFEQISDIPTPVSYTHLTLPTIWTGCAKCPKTSPTRIWSAPIWASR